MSTDTITLAQFQELVSLVQSLKTEVAQLVSRLPTIPVEEKKGRKVKTQIEKPVRVKKMCPAPSDGVVRFAGSTGENKYRVFSNMYKHTINIEGMEYPSVLHYLAYQKFVSTDKDYADDILCQKNVAIVSRKYHSKEHPSRSDWESVRSDFLSSALEMKFASEELMAILLETGEAIIEFEDPRDSIYGIGEDGTGMNILGKALMKLRAELAE
jgi:ribA/ribD-fused uncharacterized protein